MIDEGVAVIEYGLATVTVCDVTPTVPKESVAAMWMLYVPAAKTWLTVLPVAVVPSPKSIAKV